MKRKLLGVILMVPLVCFMVYLAYLMITNFMFSLIFLCGLVSFAYACFLFLIGFDDLFPHFNFDSQIARDRMSTKDSPWETKK